MDMKETRTTVPPSTEDVDQHWARISQDIAAAFRMDSTETKRFRNHSVPKLIAAIPFLAGCEDAERTAVAHVGTYLLSVRETKPYFNARPEDSESVFERLRLISSFKGGDPAIIDKGMGLLALNMLSDYRRDAEEDVFLSKFNPVSSGDFDFETIKADIVGRIEAVDCPQMDRIMNSDSATEGYWQ